MGIECAQKIDALHLDIVIGADDVSHHVFNVFCGYRTESGELSSKVFPKRIRP
jgi:hypothetical protein